MYWFKYMYSKYSYDPYSPPYVTIHITNIKRPNGAGMQLG
jgi:hypothetical protein